MVALNVLPASAGCELGLYGRRPAVYHRIVGRFLLVLSIACSAPRTGPLIDTIEPSVGLPTTDTPATIQGTFHLPVLSDVDDGTTRVEAMAVTVGGIPLAGARWRNEHLIEGTILAGLDVGVHDVVVTLGSERDTLVGGYEVTDGSPPPGDAGQPDAFSCPASYVSNAFGTSYRIVTTPRTWQAAETDCEQSGGHLAVVETAAEDSALPTSTEHWFGYSETSVQGTFLWVTGAGASTYTRWAAGEPDTIVGAYCAVTRPDGWHDDICTELKFYICECDGRPADPNAWQ